MELAKNMGYLKGRTDHMINLEDVNKFKDHEMLILTAGAQGEPNSGFSRITKGEHRIIRLKQTDTVIFSSSVVPGNERSVQTLMDNISRQVDEIYNVKIIDVHAGGHAHAADHEMVLQLIKPKFVVPIHGYYFMRKSFRKIAERAGLDPKQVMLTDNGQISEIYEDRFVMTNQKVPSSYVIVDGLGIGDVEEVVLRDRMNLGTEGMLVIILTLDRQTSRLVKTPDIISRGFIHLRDNTEIIDEMRQRVKTILARIPGDKEVEAEYIKTIIRDQIGQFIFQKTKRRPMLLPVIIEV
jgi:ribonuclease J